MLCPKLLHRSLSYLTWNWDWDWLTHDRGEKRSLPVRNFLTERCHNQGGQRQATEVSDGIKGRRPVHSSDFQQIGISFVGMKYDISTKYSSILAFHNVGQHCLVCSHARWCPWSLRSPVKKAEFVLSFYEPINRKFFTYRTSKKLGKFSDLIKPLACPISRFCSNVSRNCSKSLAGISMPSGWPLEPP